MTLEQFYQICDRIQPDERGCHRYPEIGRKFNARIHVWIGHTNMSSCKLVLERKLGRPIPSGYVTLHTCSSLDCINPDHLFEGSSSQTNGRSRNLCGDSEVCTNPHDKPIPAYACVLPFSVRNSTGDRKTTQLNKLFETIPHGTFCYECYQRYSDIIESATELLVLLNITRRLKDHVKGRV